MSQENVSGLSSSLLLPSPPVRDSESSHMGEHRQDPMTGLSFSVKLWRFSHYEREESICHPALQREALG